MASMECGSGHEVTSVRQSPMLRSMVPLAAPLVLPAEDCLLKSQRMPNLLLVECWLSLGPFRTLMPCKVFARAQWSGQGRRWPNSCGARPRATRQPPKSNACSLPDHSAPQVFALGEVRGGAGKRAAGRSRSLLGFHQAPKLEQWHS